MEPHTVRFASFMQPFKNQLVALQSMHPEALRQENYKVRPPLFSRTSFFLCASLLVSCMRALLSLSPFLLLLLEGADLLVARPVGRTYLHSRPTRLHSFLRMDVRSPLQSPYYYYLNYYISR